MGEHESVLSGVRVLFAEFPQSLTLFQAHDSDPSGIFQDGQNFRKTAESYHTLLRKQSQDRICAQLKDLFSMAGDDPFAIFPTSQEITAELLPILEPVRMNMPFHTTNVNLSCPVSFPEKTSLNLIIRMYNPEKVNTVKIKIGVFMDDSSSLFWEVGFVDVSKSIRNITWIANPGARPKGDYFMLSKLVARTKTFIRRRAGIAGLDITPAYYHVLQLSRRLGGRTVTEFDWSEWNRKLEEAYQHSRLRDDPVSGLPLKELQTVNRRYAISWLFENGLLNDPAGKALKWEPPRLVWYNPGQ